MYTAYVMFDASDQEHLEINTCMYIIILYLYLIYLMETFYANNYVSK